MSSSLQLLYNQRFGKHFVNGSLGFEARQNNSSSTSARYSGFPSGELSSIMFSQIIRDKPIESDNKTKNVGAFFRINYSYNDIYLFDTSVRFDGSSEFGSDKKYAPFWSTGIGVNIHKYAFLADSRIINQLKLTATFGQTGKLNFAPYAAKDIYDIFSKNWYSTGMGVKLKALGNENLTWEKKNNYDLKIETSLFDDMIYLKASYYNSRTKDMVSSITIPSSFGFTSYYDNLGEIENKGYELDLRLNLISKKDVFLNLYGNLAHNKNKILKIANSLREYNDKVNEYYDGYSEYTSYKEEYAKPFTKYVEGGSTTSIFGMKSLGINPTNGKEVFVKKDGSITYEWDANEQQILGNTLPDIQGSFGFNFSYKSLSLFVNFMYEYGGQQYNSTYASRIESVDLYNYNADKRVLTDRWKKIGDRSPLKDIADRGAYSRPTSRFVQDNNFIDFNSLTLSYNLMNDFIKKLNLSRVKLQFTMNNVAHISSIKRERGTSYPFARNFDFTLSVSL